ncbi:M28 family peptidase [Thermodesulfobacteriota bacterium]
MKPFLAALVLMIGLTAIQPETSGAKESAMIDIAKTSERLQRHLHVLTQEIGERSVYNPENLEKTAAYIETFFSEIAVPVHREPYLYRDYSVANVVAEISFGADPKHRYILGAHYDSVAGTVGADDNASAVAVLLETGRALSVIKGSENLDLSVKFVSFALEEPPAYSTRSMGSRVYARRAKKEKERIDGMICLEMVGYTCHDANCQDYPFPLMFMGYPEKGDFIGIVGNFSSRNFTKSLYGAFRQNRELPVVKLTVPFSGWLLPSVRLSDHASFWDQGFKSVMITDSAFFRNPHYHRASDTMEKLDYVFMAELVKSLTTFFRLHSVRPKMK